MSHYAFIIILLFILCFALIGCGLISWSDGMEEVIWDTDGKHIYYLERRYKLFIEPIEYYRLYYSLPNTHKRKLIDTGRIRSGFPDKTIFPSPEGHLLLYVKSQDLIIYDQSKQQVIYRENFQNDWPENKGWLPERNDFYLMDRTGLRVQSIDGTDQQYLIMKPMYCRCWSPDARYLIYTSDGENTLYILDTETMKHSILTTTIWGSFECAAYSSDGKQITCSLYGSTKGKGDNHDPDNAGDFISVIKLIDHDGTNEKDLWQGSGFIYSLHWTAYGDSLLFSFFHFMKSQCSLIHLNLDGQHKVLYEGSGYDFSWDYHAGTNQLIMIYPHKSEPVTFELNQSFSDSTREEF